MRRNMFNEGGGGGPQPGLGARTEMRGKSQEYCLTPGHHAVSSIKLCRMHDMDEYMNAAMPKCKISEEWSLLHHYLQHKLPNALTIHTQCSVF